MRQLPFSSKSFGPLKGIHPSTPEFIESDGTKYGWKLHRLELETSDRERPDPLTLDDKPHWRFSRRKRFVPTTQFVAEIPGGRILGEEGYAVSPDDRILTDVVWNIGSTPERHVLLSRATFPRCAGARGRLFILSALGFDSYYHWLHEVLPKLGLLRAAGVAVDKYAVCVRQPFQKETLDILGLREEQLLSLKAQSHIEAETLVCASMPSLDGEVPRWACRFLRESFLGAAVPAERSRILIVRDTVGRRAWRNQRECGVVLERFGFRAVRLESMSFREQVGALAGAEVVLAPHGAGLSNLVFARPDAKVIELFSPRYVNPCYWKLACTLRLPYAYLIGSGERPSENDDPHEVTADITVAPQELESILLRAGVRPIAGS
jgi:hypothetical protein